MDQSLNRGFESLPHRFPLINRLIGISYNNTYNKSFVVIVASGLPGELATGPRTGRCAGLKSWNQRFYLINSGQTSFTVFRGKIDFYRRFHPFNEAQSENGRK